MLKPLHLRKVLFCLTLIATLSVSAQTDVTFDVISGQASSYTQYAGQSCNVTLTGKTLTANHYAGVCFPFSATTAQLNATFGEGGWDLYQYDSYADSKISFKSATSVVAGEPYIIKVKTTITDPKFTGITFASSIPSDGVTTAGATASSDPSVKGYYFFRYSYQFVEGHPAPYTAWWIGTDGSLGNQRNYGEFPYLEKYEGCGAYIFSPTMDTAKLTLLLDGKEISSGGNSGGSGTTSNKNANLDDATKAKISNQEQLTDVPTIYLTIPDVNDLDNDLVKDRKTGEALYHKTSIKVVDANGTLTPFEETPDFLQIKVRGNSTASPSKRAYRLKFAKKHKHDLLGAGYTKRNWTLLANVFDRSLIRNAVTYHLGKAIGMPFNPGFQFVDLVINGDYRGCYQISDQVEAAADRVNVNEDTGWMFEFQGRQDMLDKPSITNGYMVSIKNPDTDDYTNAQKDSLKTEMKTWLDSWNASFNNYTGAGYKWREYNNEESIAKFYIDTNITGDYDGMMTIKAYRGDADKLLYWGPIWDKDLAYGNCTYDPADKMVENVENGLLRYLFINTLNKDGQFVARMKTMMDKLTSAGLYDNLCAKIDELGQKTAKTWALNFTRWKIEDVIPGGIDKINPANGYTTQAQYLQQLKDYLKDRINFVKTSIETEWTELGSPTYTEPRAQKNASVPTIYIDAPTIGDEWATATKMQVLDKDNLLKLGTDFTNAAFSIQYQGTGKAGKKNSYRIKFNNKQAVFGGAKYKQWVLLSNTKDPSLVRNALTKELGDGLNMAFTPRYQFVDLYLNDTYLGTYQVTDRVKAEEGRALVSGGDKANDWLLELDDKDEISEGDLYVAGDDTHPYINIKNPDQDDFSDDVNAQHKATIGDWFNSTFWTDVENNVDKTSFINWYIASEVLGDYKQFSSIYTYKSNVAGGKLFFGPLWGNEEAYGNNDKHPLDMTDLTTTGSYKGLLSIFADNGVWKQKLQELWKQDWFKKGVNDRWTAIHETLLSTLQSKLNDLKTAVSETQADNFAAATDEGAGWSRTSTEDAEIQKISDYLKDRFAYLTAKFADMAAGKAVDYIFDPSLSLADSKLMDHNNTNVNITIKGRTLHGGVWNTLCLPFNVSEEEMKTAIGGDYELQEHTATDGDVMKFMASSSKQVKHGVPYIIKPTVDSPELKFSNVTISYKEGGKDQTVSFDNNAHQFKANINHVDLATDGTNLFLGRDNKLFIATTSNYSHDGTRCYFIVEKPAAAKARVSIEGDPSTTTISQIRGAVIAAPDAIYNLAGQRISRPVKGVYIKGGKKYIVK